MKRLLVIFVCFFSGTGWAQHPIAFASSAELSFVKTNIPRYPLLSASFRDLKKSVDPWLGKTPDVPLPKDPAGGYTHERHRDNYMLLFNAGLLYQLTDDRRYAILVKDILLRYAVLNPTLKKHPQATSSSPGHIFWQALNDANWLVYAAMGYDFVYASLNASERKTIEDGAFKPEVDYITKDLSAWFNLIHNHGVWACAGVGITGIATHNEAYIKMALQGSGANGSGGFLAQLDNLFSPDGYYTEGPYYVRYALLPFYIFANALDHARPAMKIFDYRNQVLKKALEAGLQQTNTNGKFFPFNDAIKDKDVTTNELITALGIAWQAYGKDSSLLAVAAMQQKVLLNRGGVGLAASVAAAKNSSLSIPYHSVEYTDGAKGEGGGISLLRSGKNENLTTLIFKYATHGLSHGHYDQLGFILYHGGNEIFTDYGSARFVNVEQKYGGRYLPENEAYAVQTIAHNTITVDETSQFNAKESVAEKYAGEKLFSSIGNHAVQVVAARQEHAYKDVQLNRSLYLISLPGSDRPLIVDLFSPISDASHQYDLAYQYSGQVISTSFAYKAFTDTQQVLGSRNGYQFLWKEAQAQVRTSPAQFTFLNNGSYYSISSLVQDSATVLLTRTGANDPRFNLRREPAYMIRRQGTSLDFVSVLELHGHYDAVTESSVQSHSSVEGIQILKKTADLIIIQIRMKGKVLVIAQMNNGFNKEADHSILIDGHTYAWRGPFGVWWEGRKMSDE
jgi:oligo-alginate lyase